MWDAEWCKKTIKDWFCILAQSGEIGELMKIREFGKALSSLCFTLYLLSKLPNLPKLIIAPIITHCSLKKILRKERFCFGWSCICRRRLRSGRQRRGGFQVGFRRCCNRQLPHNTRNTEILALIAQTTNSFLSSQIANNEQ